jgi:hypothetical protein
MKRHACNDSAVRTRHPWDALTDNQASGISGRIRALGWAANRHWRAHRWHGPRWTLVLPWACTEMETQIDRGDYSRGRSTAKSQARSNIEAQTGSSVTTYA